MTKTQAKGKKADTLVEVIAYKGFDKDLKCRGFQYEVGQTYEHKGAVKACEAGFHACESPFDVWSYYGPFESRYAIVKMGGELSRHSEDSKIASAKITITAELSMPELIKSGIDWLIDATKKKSDDASGNYARIGSSGDSARIGSSGDHARIGSSGDFAQIGSSGNYARIGSSGDRARIGSSGYNAQIGSSGYNARIGSSGDSARIGSSGDFAQIDATGKDSVIACAGSVDRFRVGPGGCISVPWHDGNRTRFTTLYDGEDGIKGEVWYSLDGNGKPVEVAP